MVNEKIEGLRKKLLDTTRRNPLINNTFSARANSFLRIVDEKPQSIIKLLSDNTEMMLASLPALDSEPTDEESSEFQQAYSDYQLIDKVYLEELGAIDFDSDQSAYQKEVVAERALKDRVRSLLEYPERVMLDSQENVARHARNHNINPSYNLPDAEAESENGHFEDNVLQTLVMPKTFQARMSRIFSRQRTLTEEKGFQYLLLPAYVLTAHASFQKELRSFSNFDDMLFISDKDENFEEKVRANADKKLVIATSLHTLEESLGKYNAVAE